ncbi:hypothetical protein Zmor_012422 [Zophobas morio]|uniref:Uncharacterized protein n=1 Tax=Zophobas morio TaxID=2755281 RepID=A0AA38HHT2_9CUCU|nr:hypothetical protein Zmor_012422 [Zophobas morio]
MYCVKRSFTLSGLEKKVVGKRQSFTHSAVDDCLRDYSELGGCQQYRQVHVRYLEDCRRPVWLPRETPGRKVRRGSPTVKVVSFEDLQGALPEQTSMKVQYAVQGPP